MNEVCTYSGKPSSFALWINEMNSNEELSAEEVQSSVQVDATDDNIFHGDSNAEDTRG